jgi:predicted DNA-binding transcriptional regulator AlpA
VAGGSSYRLDRCSLASASRLNWKVTVTMTADEVRALPAVVDLSTAARALGLGRSAAYELVRTGGWPTPVLRLGRLIKVPSAPLVELLCLNAGEQSLAHAAHADRG